MYYYLFTDFARRMALVMLCLSGALILGMVYVHPRVNAASALLAESIRIEAPEINLGSVEMKKMVDQLKEVGVVSGRVTFVRHNGVWLDANLELRGGRPLATSGSSFASDDPDLAKAAREALSGFITALKEVK